MFLCWYGSKAPALTKTFCLNFIGLKKILQQCKKPCGFLFFLPQKCCRSDTAYFQNTTNVTEKMILKSWVFQHVAESSTTYQSSSKTHLQWRVCKSKFLQSTQIWARKLGKRVLLQLGKVPLQSIHMTTNYNYTNHRIATLFLGLTSAGANVSAQLCVRDKNDLARAIVSSRQSRQSQRTKVRK